MTQPQTRVYTHGVLTTQNCAISDISEHLAKEGTILWVDLYGPTAQELHALADELGLHELAVEDALGEHQRPKVDHYATHLFFACKAVSMDIGATKLVEHEIDAFIGDRWLITVRKHEDLSMAPVVARWDRSPDLAKHGVSFLL